jgi:hypothetical protein
MIAMDALSDTQKLEALMSLNILQYVMLVVDCMLR